MEPLTEVQILTGLFGGTRRLLIMDANDLNTKGVEIAYDTEKPIVWVDTGDGDRGLGPDAARDLADDFEDVLDRGDAPDTTEHRRLVNTLRQYADKAEGN